MTTKINISTNQKVDININQPKAKSATRRVCLSIPEADSDVIQWIDSQVNVSGSMRRLIRESINREGITDVTCRAEYRSADEPPAMNGQIAGYPKSSATSSLQTATKAAFLKTAKHILDDNTTTCRSFDQNGVMVSASKRDNDGLVYYCNQDPAKRQYVEYIRLLNQYNEGRKW